MVVLADPVVQWASENFEGKADPGDVAGSHALAEEVRSREGHGSLEVEVDHSPCHTRGPHLGCQGSHGVRRVLETVVAAGTDLVVGLAGSRRVVAAAVGIVEVVVGMEAAGVVAVEGLVAALTVHLR